LGSRTHLGELLKEDIKVATATIRKYSRKARHPPAPSETGSVFFKNHTNDVWGCDFLPVIDLFSRQFYLFFFVELGSLRIVHFNITARLTDAWVAQQLRETTPYGQAPRFLIRDRDRKYGETFTRVAVGTAIEVLKTPNRAPKANAICERFLGSVRRECLDHIPVLGEVHLHRLIREYVEYFNRARPHQRIEQQIPEGRPSTAVERGKAKIIVFPVLSGLHHDYRLAA
jgi:transposase InsO family protein